MFKTKINNVSYIAQNDLCCGCGTCAGICPNNAIQMDSNAYGEYVPTIESDKCKKSCKICLQACPFSDLSKNEDEISASLWGNNLTNNQYIGHYSNCYCGYVKDEKQRLNSASGGLLTNLLIQLLNKRIVDNVICVEPVINEKKMFSFKICQTVGDILLCSKSCYYPVEASEIIKHIMNNNGKYAIVGVPCLIKSLRNAQLLYPFLKDRISLLLGLVCGQQKNKNFIDYLFKLTKSYNSTYNQVTFRIKSNIRPASNYGLSYFKDNKFLDTIYWNDGMNKVWGDRWYTLNACDYCDDLFAETADAAFMDAWLPHYSNDYRGTSFVISRNETINKLLINNATQIEDISIKNIIDSQKGALHYKTEMLGKRLSYFKSKTKYIPKKRIHPRKYGLITALTLKRDSIIRNNVKKYYSKSIDLNDFQKLILRNTSILNFSIIISNKIKRLIRKRIRL